VFKGVVAGIIVDNDHLKISVTLQEQRIDALNAFRPTVPVHENDRDGGLGQELSLRDHCCSKSRICHAIRQTGLQAVRSCLAYKSMK
jgi:hypothetical protein